MSEIEELGLGLAMRTLELSAFSYVTARNEEQDAKRTLLFQAAAAFGREAQKHNLFGPVTFSLDTV